MTLNFYRIAIITSLVGITDQQKVWAKQKLTWMANNFPQCRFELHAPGFHDNQRAQCGVARSVWSTPWPAGITLHCLPGFGDQSLKVQIDHCIEHFKDFDEVWCMPNHGQTTYLHRTRPMGTFRSAKNLPNFKLVPPWVEAEQKAKRPNPEKKVKAPWTHN